jgi:hypothetical protein
MKWTLYDDGRIRFEYPAEWEVEVAEDDEADRASITLQSSSGNPAFGMITVDGDTGAADPQGLADEALEAMRSEYPGLDLVPVGSGERVGGALVVGYDLEFLSLDMPSACLIRSFRTERRSVLVFAQWSELDEADTGGEFRRLLATLVEVDGDET